MIAWLAEPNNANLVGGIATFAAAIIASSTVLIVAFVAYPMQKKEDRKLQLHDFELRLDYESKTSKRAISRDKLLEAYNMLDAANPG